MKFWLKVPIYLFWMAIGVVILTVYVIVTETVKLAQRMGKERV